MPDRISQTITFEPCKSCSKNAS